MATTDSLPLVSAGAGLLPPSLSASSFGRPTSSFKKEEEQRKKERTLSGEGMGGGFDPTKAFGERRGSRSASSGSAGESRDAVRKEAGERKEAMGSVLEEEKAVSWTPPPIQQAQDQDQQQQQQQNPTSIPAHLSNATSSSSHFALTPGLDTIPFSDSFAKALEENKVNVKNASS
ncbi:hypothetical protein BDY24DRAFT_401727 [Mrakia frigida]|uniref:uncharacterized protein n=1 Tax=Mrakia frigida TaxID=29902 RepID=UPI003FCC0A59